MHALTLHGYCAITCALMSSPINSTDQKRRYLDTVAAVLSGVCMLHCLALPLVFTLLPIVNVSLLSEQTFHLVMIVFILPVSVVALSIGCRQHKDLTTFVLGTIGLSILTFTAVAGHTLFGVTGERLVTSLGGLILASAHIQNYRACLKDNCEHDHN